MSSKGIKDAPAVSEVGQSLKGMNCSEENMKEQVAERKIRDDERKESRNGQTSSKSITGKKQSQSNERKPTVSPQISSSTRAGNPLQRSLGFVRCKIISELETKLIYYPPTNSTLLSPKATIAVPQTEQQNRTAETAAAKRAHEGGRANSVAQSGAATAGMSLPVDPAITFMGVDMDRPLNKSHAIEREAEQELQLENFDKADQKYVLAAEMMKEALAELSGTKLVRPLQAQLDKLVEMRTVVAIKRKEASRRAKHEESESSSSQLNENTEQSMNSPKHSPQSTKTPHDTLSVLANLEAPKSTDHGPVSTTWQLLPEELTTMVDDREMDSLLQFLNQPVDLLSSKYGTKRPKSQDEVIEQFTTRLNLLQKTAVVLIQALEDKENENTTLKNQLDEMRFENMELHERVELYEQSRRYAGIEKVPIDVVGSMLSDQPDSSERKVPVEMMASMLIDQPESYFEFNAENMEAELREASRDVNLSPVSSNCKSQGSGLEQRRRTDSVQYEDLDTSNEVLDTSNSSSAQSRMASLAGLPPLSPVHFEIDDGDDILS